MLLHVFVQVFKDILNRESLQQFYDKQINVIKVSNATKTLHYDTLSV